MRAAGLLTSLVLASLMFGGCHQHEADDGRSPAQREQARKTDEGAKKGALKKKADPADDLKLQMSNLERLRINEKENRDNGNHIGAWAAARDARKVEELIAKDRAALSETSEK